jgi:transcriptional regulator with XRE-family HTH domain
MWRDVYRETDWNGLRTNSIQLASAINRVHALEDLKLERVGITVEKLRVACGMNRLTLSDKAGMFYKTLSRIEGLETFPRFENIFRIAQALEAPVSLLFGEANVIRNANFTTDVYEDIFGQRLEAVREQLKFSVGEMALFIGYSRQNYYRLHNGIIQPTEGVIRDVILKCKVPPSFLLGEEREGQILV